MKSEFLFIMFCCLLSCSKDKYISNDDFKERNASIEIHRCYCTPSAYRYLILITDNNSKAYYNPINLPDDYKEIPFDIVFSGNLLTDSSSVYSNLANDAVIELFKARNLNLTSIRKIK